MVQARDGAARVRTGRRDSCHSVTSYFSVASSGRNSGVLIPTWKSVAGCVEIGAEFSGAESDLLVWLVCVWLVSRKIEFTWCETYSIFPVLCQPRRIEYTWGEIESPDFQTTRMLRCCECLTILDIIDHCEIGHQKGWCGNLLRKFDYVDHTHLIINISNYH